MRHILNFAEPDNGKIVFDFSTEVAYIECILIPRGKYNRGKLYICSVNEINLFLGTLSESEKGLYLNKSYPISYFADNGILCENMSGFKVEFEDGKIITCFLEGENISDDPAIKRAEELLGAMADGLDHSGEAEICRQRIASFLSEKPEQPFNCFKSYTWYVVDDIKETLGLSSVEHLIFNEFFIRAYVSLGRWFFGVGNKIGYYAVAIYADDGMSNPFVNANDCAIIVDGESSGQKLYAVGIGIFDDGQYFYRIEQ